ncbi:hypothetical protein Q4493_00940 [Colwellia sp. 1_MG-2023]|uniref:hypothetical protein n=1 Tax=Colwellia sp. 1_MG-2023 TaxID=3062649 RepID=UPI0026E4517A|nr:hypothetical protein [Colwellia sp. 1_MG-2023]MDO6444329.1 hypothetical protein [Colwellia sp. 1_MG-2023]
MNLFKKALVASAITAVCATSQAADLTDAVTKHSAQGLEVAAGAAATSSLRVIVREQLEAGDQITLVFGKGVTGIASVAVDGNGDATTTGADTQLGLVYGSGTYKLRPVSVTTTSGVTTVIVEVATGDPVTKDSSFEVQVRGADFDKTKASETTVTYSAKSGLTGDAKDTTGDNTGLLIVTADQYTASVKTKLNGVIEREAQKTFISGGNAANSDDDSLVITLGDDQTLASAANDTLVQATVTVAGDFSAATLTGGTAPVLTSDSADDVIGAVAVAADKKSISFTVTDTAVADGIAGELTLVLDNDAGVIKASEFTASVSVDADTGSATNTKQLAMDTDAAGEWEVDATIITIPYLPVGYEGTSSSVHFSNTSSSAVDVIVSAVTTVDSEGASVTYPAMDLGMDLPANSVTKVSQGMLKTLFGIEGSAKLSVTFNVDADNKDVTAYAFTTDDSGRTEISNTAQKGIK